MENTNQKDLEKIKLSQEKTEANRISSKKYRDRIKKVKIDTERLQKEKLIVLDIFSDEWKHLMLLPPQIKSKKTFTNPFLLVHFHFGYPLDSLHFSLRMNILKEKERWNGQFKEIIFGELNSLCIQIENSLQIKEYYYNHSAAIQLWRTALSTIKKKDYFSLDLVESAVKDFEQFYVHYQKSGAVNVELYHKRWSLYISTKQDLNQVLFMMRNKRKVSL
jgi:hypothetical protein